MVLIQNPSSKKLLIFLLALLKWNADKRGDIVPILIFNFEYDMIWNENDLHREVYLKVLLESTLVPIFRSPDCGNIFTLDVFVWTMVHQKKKKRPMLNFCMHSWDAPENDICRRRTKETIYWTWTDMKNRSGFTIDRFRCRYKNKYTPLYALKVLIIISPYFLSSCWLIKLSNNKKITFLFVII